MTNVLLKRIEMIIRTLEEKDLLLRVEWMNDERIYSSMHYSFPVLMDNTISWFKQNKGNDRRTDVIFEEDGIPVAMGGLTNINRDINKAELYIFVNPKMQQKGIGTNATKMLCKFGFERLGLNKIYLETNEDNILARRVYEKCGFKLEGILRCEYKTKEGTFLNRIYYGLLRGELHE